MVDKKSDRLHVEVTASNSKKFVILKKDIPVESRKMGNDVSVTPGSASDGEKDLNHIERLWSYLAVKELLSSWVQSNSEQEKEQLRRKAQDLALKYHFLTPFTSMKLRKPGLHTNRLEDTPGMSAATGPAAVVQNLREAGTQPGRAAAGVALRVRADSVEGRGSLGGGLGYFLSYCKHCKQ